MLDKAHDLLALFIRYKRALHTQRLARADGRVEHIAHADELFRAGGIKNDAALKRGRDRKGDAARDVRLHEAGDDIGRRALRRNDEVHTRSAAHLRHAADALLHLFGGAEHEVGQLVDDDDDLRQRLPVGFVLLQGVVACQIAHLRLGKQAVALEHLHDRPLQCAGCLLGVGHDGDEQVRDAIIDAELDHLRVDHDQAHLVRRRLIEQAEDERVHANGLTGAGRTGDEHMRQLGDVADDAVAADVLADGKRELGLGIAECGRVDNIAQADRADDLVRHLDADGRDLVRDRRDAHILHAERERKVTGEVRDLVELHARLELEIVACDRRAARHVADRGIDAEAAQSGIEPVAVEADLLRCVGLILLPRAQK